MTSQNLWGELGDDKIMLPVTILKAQAAKLGQLTDNVLEGRIDQINLEGARVEFCYDLDIIAPALNDYVYTAVRIKHNIEGYPVTVSDCTDGFEDEMNIEDEDEFVSHLARILSSEHVHRVVNALLGQSTDVSK